MTLNPNITKNTWRLPYHSKSKGQCPIYWDRSFLSECSSIFAWGEKNQVENYSGLLSKSFRARWLKFLEMINSSIGKSKATFPLGQWGMMKIINELLKNRKNANIPNAPQWCAKKVFKMLHYCYNLKAWKLYKLQTENGRDNRIINLWIFSLLITDKNWLRGFCWHFFFLQQVEALILKLWNRKTIRKDCFECQFPCVI